MLPISSTKEHSIRSTLTVTSSLWRLVVVLTLISCWGTLGTLYYFVAFSTWNPQQQPKPSQAEGALTPSEGHTQTSLPWLSSVWLTTLLRNDRAPLSRNDASCRDSTAISGNPIIATGDEIPATTAGPAINPTKNFSPTTQGDTEDEAKASKPPSLLVQYGDSIYLRGDWDAAPVVVEKYKLIFFTVPKVGCTAFKQLLRRMMGHKNWAVEEYDKMLPWNPSTNGLRYLYDYPPEQASDMMTSDAWTRAIFVREPKARLLSAYLDKAFHKTYLREKCCFYTGSCVAPARANLGGFLRNIVHFCDNAHWRPQHKRMEDKYWPHVKFVGHMETIEADARRLLERVGAWKAFGASGWGPFRNGTLFGASSSTNGGQKHATDAAAKLRQYYSDPNLTQSVESYYAQDYASPHLNITRLVW